MVETIFEDDNPETWKWAFRLIAVMQMLWFLLLFDPSSVSAAAMVVDTMVWIWVSSRFMRLSREIDDKAAKQARRVAISSIGFVLLSAIWRRPIFTDNYDIETALASSYAWFLLANVCIGITYYSISEIPGLDLITIDNKVSVTQLFSTAAMLNVFAALTIVMASGSETILSIALAVKIAVVPFLVAFASLRMARAVVEHVDRENKEPVD